jgi:hypothetical protein
MYRPVPTLSPMGEREEEAGWEAFLAQSLRWGGVSYHYCDGANCRFEEEVWRCGWGALLV